MPSKPPVPNPHPPGHFDATSHRRDASGKFAGAGKTPDRRAGTTKPDPMKKPGARGHGFGGGLGAGSSGFGQMVGD